MKRFLTVAIVFLIAAFALSATQNCAIVSNNPPSKEISQLTSTSTTSADNDTIQDETNDGEAIEDGTDDGETNDDGEAIEDGTDDGETNDDGEAVEDGTDDSETNDD